MATSTEKQPETLPENPNDGRVRQNPNNGTDPAHDFETLARSWLSMLPADHSLTVSDVETWLQSNNSSLPDHIKSMPPSDVFQLITSFSTDVNPSNEALEEMATNNNGNITCPRTGLVCNYTEVTKAFIS